MEKKISSLVSPSEYKEMDVFTNPQKAVTLLGVLILSFTFFVILLISGPQEAIIFALFGAFLYWIAVGIMYVLFTVAVSGKMFTEAIYDFGKWLKD